jgi:hypothetical protein
MYPQHQVHSIRLPHAEALLASARHATTSLNPLRYKLLLLHQGRKLEVPNIEHTHVKNYLFWELSCVCWSSNRLRNTKPKKYPNLCVKFHVRKPINIGKENWKVRFWDIIFLLIGCTYWCLINLSVLDNGLILNVMSCRMSCTIMRRLLNLLILQRLQILHHVHFHGSVLILKL